jgi:glycosyltransferase involved in cell wall biosynthesis
VPSERIDVVLPGFGTDDRAPPTPEAELRRAHGLGEGAIVLAVSAKKAHKNLARLLDAMAIVHDRRPDAVLVVPGNPTAHEQELREQSARLGIEHAIRFPAYVSNEDLEGLYRAARCFVFPSITEGFGLPVLEAQRRRVPVATSNTSSLPEAGGDGALYFDPYDVRDIARAVLDLLENRELATRLVAAGERHVEGFTWERAAEGTLETYERAWTQRRGA